MSKAFPKAVKDKETAYALLRLALGINIFLHGVVRLGENYDKFVNGTVAMFANAPIPVWSVSLFAHVLPIVELIIGALLILGLGTRLAAILGSWMMMALIAGMALLQKWDVVGLQMTYVLFYFVVLFLQEYNGYSLDKWLSRKRTFEDQA